MSAPRLAVVIVNHDGGDDVIACLRSVVDDFPHAELIIVDNASRDDSPDAIADAFPDARLVRNARNLGFAVAANQGVRTATAPSVLLLNPDATVSRGALSRLLETLEADPAAAAVGPLVTNPDGSVQPSKRSFPTVWEAAQHGLLGLVWPDNPGSRAYLLADADLSGPTEVGWISGSAMLLRREAFEAVGGFDEDFFFFVEDVDLCRRLRDAGWSIRFEPRAHVVHAWGGSWTRRPLRFLWLHHRNLFRYVRKHRRGAWVLAYPAILVGLALRFVLLALRWLVARRTVPAHRRTKEVAR